MSLVDDLHAKVKDLIDQKDYDFNNIIRIATKAVKFVSDYPGYTKEYKSRAVQDVMRVVVSESPLTESSKNNLYLSMDLMLPEAIRQAFKYYEQKNQPTTAASASQPNQPQYNRPESKGCFGSICGK